MPRSRRKLDTSPIEYDEVVDSPALKGMVSFLEFPPGELPRLDFTTPAVGPPATGTPSPGNGTDGIPVGDAPSPRGPEEGAPFYGVPDTRVPAPTLPALAVPALEIPASVIPAAAATALEGIPLGSGRIGGGPEVDIPFEGVPSMAAPHAALATLPSYPPVMARPMVRIRRATSAQDGHSFGEQALYDALWQHAHAHDSETRIVTVGYRRMAELARLTVNNCKANIQSLIQKLAVEEVASFTHSQGRTYLVYSHAAIIERRKKAGLTHYIKSRGVTFVDPDSGEPLTERIRDRSGIPFSGAPRMGAVPEGGDWGAPESCVAGIPDSAKGVAGAPRTAAGQAGDGEISRMVGGEVGGARMPRKGGGETPGGAPAELIQGLRQIVGFVDQEAATVLWHQCRRRAGDCTAGEVLHFARTKAAVMRSGKIQNPTGFLLAAVPKCFDGAGIAEYRQEQARALQVESERQREVQEQVAQMRRDFEAILEDPNSTEEDRRLVKRLLEAN
jgi:hypothetical protein